jgi:hypothetical protein
MRNQKNMLAFTVVPLVGMVSAQQFWQFWQLEEHTYIDGGVIGASKVDDVQYQTEQGCKTAAGAQKPLSDSILMGKWVVHHEYLCVHIGDVRQPLTNPGP